jgi:hypothetical protein
MTLNMKNTRQVASIDLAQTQSVPPDALNGYAPVLLKSLVSHWPMTQKSQASIDQAMDYLLSFYNGKPTMACKGSAQDKGRFFYNDEVSQLNYTSRKLAVDEILLAIREGIGNELSDNYYIPSNPSESHFPGFMQQNNINIPLNSPAKHPGVTIVPNLWIGGKTIASCHYDVHKNIACCTTGKRRFTLFPPEQIRNLYPGPFEITPGGPVISMVDFSEPDFEKHPRFREALEHAHVVELSPGDALYIPPLWWHHVEGLDDFNILVNYWWDEAPRYLGSPMNALHDAMLSIRDRSTEEKQAWKDIFDYYVFGQVEQSHQHLPENAKGILAPLDENTARKLRALVINRLNK